MRLALNSLCWELVLGERVGDSGGTREHSIATVNYDVQSRTYYMMKKLTEVFLEPWWIIILVNLE